MNKLFSIFLSILLTLNLAAQDNLIPITVEVDDNKFTSPTDERQLAIYFRSHLKTRGFNTDVSESKFTLRLVPILQNSDRATRDNVMLRMHISLVAVEYDAVLASAIIDTAVYGYIRGWDNGTVAIGGSYLREARTGGTDILEQYGRCFANNITQVEQFIAIVREMLYPMYNKNKSEATKND